MTTFENTLIKLEKGKKPSSDEFNFLKKAFKILLFKSKNTINYASLKKINLNRLTKSDIEEVKYFFKDWSLVGQEPDGIIPINFQNPKNKTCHCAFCGKEVKIEDINKVSSNYLPRCKVSVKLCNDCTEILDPYGKIGKDDTSYEDAKKFLNDCKKLIPKYKKNPYYIFMKKSMENNYKLISFSEDFKKEYISLINDYSTAMFNYIYAVDHNTLDEELIRCIKELMEGTYDWSNIRNCENIPTFIPQIANFVLSYQTYLGKFKICLNNIVSNKDNYDEGDYYSILKDIHPMLNTFKEYNKLSSINGRYSITIWIKDRAESTDIGLIPDNDDLYALILTIGDEEENYKYIKYNYNPKGVTLISHFKNGVESLYTEKVKRKDNSEFGKMIERMHEYLEDIDTESTKSKTRKKRHRQRSSYQPS